jgi:biopolymer transport protein ExbD
MWRRVPSKVWIGIGLILLGAAILGGWRWWMATRTWVPLEMPISLAKGHIRSPEFSTNFDGSFWILIEVETAVDHDGVSCLTDYDYSCSEKNAHELRATWTLSKLQEVIAHGPTNRYPAYPYYIFGREIDTKARELGVFEVPAGEHYVLDIDISEDYSRFDGGHPHVAIVTRDYWTLENWQVWVALLSLLLAAIGVAMVLYPVAVWVRRKNQYQSISFTFPGRLSSDLVTGTDPSVVAESRADRPWQAWIGFALLLLGIVGYFGVRHWYKTRIFDAVDTPVSLVQGHRRTGPFRLNLSATHYVSVDAGGARWYYLPPTCDREMLKTKWTLLRDGKVVQEEYRQSWWFDAKPGLYDLDLEILADASCLDRYHPRIRVYTDRSDYESRTHFSEAIAALLAATGASLFILALRLTPYAKPVALNLSPNHSQNIQWAQRLPLRPPISRMPGFGVIAGTIFGILVWWFMVLAPVTPRGLWVHLLKPGQLPAKSDAWTDPLIVKLKDEGPGQEPKLLVNSKETTWIDLDRVLKQELALRKDWVVHVTADDCLPWSNVTNVIDVAHHEGAKVVLFHDPHEKPCDSPPVMRGLTR